LAVREEAEGFREVGFARSKWTPGWMGIREVEFVRKKRTQNRTCGSGRAFVENGSSTTKLPQRHLKVLPHGSDIEMRNVASNCADVVV